MVAQITAEQGLFEQRTIWSLELRGQRLLARDGAMAKIAIALVVDENFVADGELVKAFGVELTVSGGDEAVLAIVLPSAIFA